MAAQLNLTETEESLLSTGISQLDEFLGGGLDPGTVILLVEPSGAGGEIFAKQFAGGGTPNAGVNSVYVSTEEREDEVKRAFARFNFTPLPRIVSVSETHARHVLAKRDPSQRFAGALTARDLLMTDSSEVLRATRNLGSHDLLDELIKPYSNENLPARMTVHTLDFFLGLYGIDKVAEALTALKAANENLGGLVLLVLTANSPLRAQAEGLLDRIASCVIELEFKRRGGQFEKFLLVKKVRNKFLGVGVAPYQVTERGFELDNLNRIL